MDQDNSSDDASTSDTVSSRTRPPADNVDRDREERLLRDRVRKRQKKKRVQAEENDLKRQLSELENKLTVLRGESIVRRGLTDRRRLQSNLVFEFEKAMLYQGLVSTPRQNSAMILDPREDAYVFHTVSPDTTLPPAVLRPIMAQQLAKLSPWVMEQLSRSTADNGAFSFVMDDGGQDIAFLEMRKFLVMHTSVDAAARGLFDAMTGEGSSLVRHGGATTTTMLDGSDLFVKSVRTSSQTTHHLVQIVTLAPDRVVVMQRSLAQDEHVAGWFVFEASSPTTSVMQGYTQVSLQSTPQNAAQVYTAFMTRSTRSNAILNHLLDKLNVVVAYN
ncbi:hypothetical protein AaE_001118 [Aphanomyces astaci]|uniref:Uncharacterized protein n=1 Tax=Aphanomyces astaci TaxID=112090 RepID=A0A6A5AXB4_APHAT|nr:hypothetical protein AaE_001118 [Aphanomyces astaci]